MSRTGWSGKDGKVAAYGFMLYYKGDKPADDISWRKCVSNSDVGGNGNGNGNGNKNCRSRFIAAMRQAVNDQITRFNKLVHLNPIKCANCGTRGEDVRFHVDHCGECTSFAQLVSAFLHGRTDVPDGRMGVTDAPELLCRHKFRDEHESFVCEWQSYHKEHARLQFVCMRCNLITLKRQRNFPHSVTRL